MTPALDPASMIAVRHCVLRAALPDAQRESEGWLEVWRADSVEAI
jgi:hypothetical protein